MFNQTKNTVAFVVSCLVICGSIFAEIDYSKPYTIPELIDIALTNNPNTYSVWWNARRAAAATDLAKSAYYPNVRFRASVQNGYDYKYPNGHETEYTSLTAGLILNYILFDFGERSATSEAAKAALIAANWQYDWQIQDIMQKVINNAYTYLHAQVILSSQKESLQDAQRTLEAADELNQVGLRSITDVYSMRATVSELQISITLQNAEVDIARANLAASLGICVDSPLILAMLPIPQSQGMQQDLCALIDTAYQCRTDLMAKRANLQEKLALTKRARAAFLPKVSFYGDGGYKHYVEDHSNGGNYNVALNLDVPLYDGFETIYRTRMAYNDAKATEAELASLQLDIALEVLTYSRWFEAAENVLKLANENLQNSIKTFEGVMDKYRAGTQSIFDLTVAQRQLAEARIKHGDAKIRWYRALAQLAYATGTCY